MHRKTQRNWRAASGARPHPARSWQSTARTVVTGFRFPCSVRARCPRSRGKTRSGDPTASPVVLVPVNSELELQPHDVGTGISQLVPVVVLAPGDTELVATVEQPELHLHPRLQAALGDLLIEGARGKTAFSDRDPKRAPDPAIAAGHLRDAPGLSSRRPSGAETRRCIGDLRRTY